MTTYNVGYFVGSFASDSINRKLAGALIRLAPRNLEFTEVSIGDFVARVLTVVPPPE